MSVSEEPVTSVLRPGEIVYDPENPDRKWDADEEVLAALGYRPEFKREFSLFTCFSVSFAVLGLLPSFATTLYYGMGEPRQSHPGRSLEALDAPNADCLLFSRIRRDGWYVLPGH